MSCQLPISIKRPEMNEGEPLKVFSYIFGMSSIAGLAALMRSGKDLTLRAITTASLNSGVMGVSIAMIWVHLYGIDHIWFVSGISLLAGLGGTSLMDFAYQSAVGVLQVYAARLGEQAPMPPGFNGSNTKPSGDKKPDA